MTIERELLKRIAKYRDTIPPEFIYEICELLAQHEQTEQEHVGIVRIIGGYPDNSERVVDWVRPYKYLKDGDKLYLAPPKREPLGLEIMDVCGSEDYREGFKDGALYAEKAHGIGGGE